MKTKASKTHLLCLATLMMAFLLFPNPAQANLAQRHVLDFGINLGWATAYVEFYNDADPARAAYVDACLTRAAAHLRKAEELFQEPFATIRKRSGILGTMLAKLSRYRTQTAGYPKHQKASYLRSIWKAYQGSFNTTYDTSRPDAVHYQPNCDLFTLDAGYHLGRAHIASGVPGSQARYYQGGANGNLLNAIREGTNIAMDGNPPQSGYKKVCCSFGSPAAWRGLPPLKSSSPPMIYDATRVDMQTITLNASLDSGQCGGRSLGCHRLVGNWRWFNGGQVHICPDGSFIELFNGRLKGSGKWVCVDERKSKVLLRWAPNNWKDHLQISGDGQSLKGVNQGGNPVSGHKISGQPNCRRSQSDDPIQRYTCRVKDMSQGSNNLCHTFVRRQGRFHYDMLVVNKAKIQAGYRLPSGFASTGRMQECHIMRREELQACQVWRNKR